MRTSESDLDRSSRSCRCSCHAALLTSAITESAEGPASSTPHSSKTSRTAAATSSRAVASSVSRRPAHSRGDGPAHGRRGSASRTSTPPPGKAIIRGANAMLATRRSMNTSTPARTSRTNMTVAAGRGVAAWVLSRCQASACWRRVGESLTGKSRITVVPPRVRGGAACHSTRQHPEPRWSWDVSLLGERDDDLHLDGGVQRQHGHTDSGAGVDAGVAEGLAEQLAGTVDDARLASEGGVAGDEPDHLDHLGHPVEVAHHGLDRRDGVERADLGELCGLLRVDLALAMADLADRGELAGDHRQLAGGVDAAPVLQRRDVGRHGLGHVGDGHPQVLQPVLDCAHPQAFSRFRYATRPPPSGPVRTCTSSQPSSPHWSRICLVAWTMSGTVAYSHLLLLMSRSLAPTPARSEPGRELVHRQGMDATTVLD